MYVLLVLTSSWLGYLQDVLKHELHIKVKGNMLYEANVRWHADWMAAGCALGRDFIPQIYFIGNTSF